jgi:hypothetical protein
MISRPAGDRLAATVFPPHRVAVETGKRRPGACRENGVRECDHRGVTALSAAYAEFSGSRCDRDRRVLDGVEERVGDQEHRV